MNRAQFAQFLSRSVADRLIASSIAAALLRKFDEGGIKQSDLPLLFAIAALTSRDIEQANELPSLSREALQDEFEREARLLAGEVGNSLPVSAWHQRMRQLIISHPLRQFISVGGELTEEEIIRLSDLLIIEQAYLARFADKVSVGRLTASPLTVAAIANQAIQYSGFGRSQWFEADARFNSSDGDVVDYERRFPSTCQPCLDAEAGSPYRVGFAPLPASVCLGGGRCRCRLELRFAPSEAQRIAA